MDNSVNIRKATLNDLEAILSIENACFDCDRFSRRQFSYLISNANGILYVVESNRQIVGYLSLLQRSGTMNTRIYSIAVHPDARGQQIGQILMDKAKEYAQDKGFRQISLEVRPDNSAAINLYRKNGFITVSVIKGYYGDGSDALRMKVSI